MGLYCKHWTIAWTASHDTGSICHFESWRVLDACSAKGLGPRFPSSSMPLAPEQSWQSRFLLRATLSMLTMFFAAIAYNRPFCQSCALMCPPGVQQVLWENSSTLSRQWNCPDLSRIRVCMIKRLKKGKPLQGQPGRGTAVHSPPHSFACLCVHDISFSWSRCTL